ncbi:DUF1963 domain-containing protein [Pseudomonas sp. 3A(2025)]
MSFSTTASAVASGITLGGNAARVEHWPHNPDGEPLMLVATIDCSQALERTQATSLPAEGALYVFSTYSATDYFLDSITSDAAVMQQPTRPSGYTAVLPDGDHTLKYSPVQGIEQRAAVLGERSLEKDSIAACSLICTASPHWAAVEPHIGADYEFFCQFYSSDFPEPFKDLFYLTDAVAHLYLRKAHSQAQAAGLFFVHTA